jgi:hypothetical protein
MERNAIKKMKNKNLAYLSIAIGVSVMAIASKEKLSVEEQAAGVITNRDLGKYAILFGGAVLLYQYFNRK